VRFSPEPPWWKGSSAAGSASGGMASTPDLRVSKGFGTRAYDQLRISVISGSAEPHAGSIFDYFEPFKYKWKQNYLASALKTVTPGKPTTLSLGVRGTEVRVRLPAQGAGVAGVLIADPCVNSPVGANWVACQYGDKFQTLMRTPALINAFVRPDSTDFWSIIGDNFYDRTGEITADVFGRISLEAKSTLFMTVAGNHDYWVLGFPQLSSIEDQCGNGHMQFYAQDAKAAEHVKAGSSQAPFNFSIDPNADRPLGFGCNLPDISNFFWYNQVGNVGFVGQSGAYSLEESMPFMKEACAWLVNQPGLQVVVLLGHWDIPGMGATTEMAMPRWYTEMAELPGCIEFHQRGMLKYIMGHTHCNDPHPHGQTGAGFRVAGFGMEGCGNYGIPVLDTTAGHVRFWYFDTSTDELYRSVLDCVEQKGWRQCTSMATLWLDQPIAPAVSV